jgi:flagellar hook-basal body complex protein FliE
MRVDAIQHVVGLGEGDGGMKVKGADLIATPEVSFSDLLAGAVHDAAATGHVADAKADALARGTLDDLHGTMISAKEAEISLHLVGTIRNRLLDAFHELWRTNV